MQIAAISFDVVDTFLHFAEPVAETYERFGHKHGLIASQATIGKRFKMVFQAAPTMVPGEGEDKDAYEKGWWRQLASRIFGCDTDDPAFTKCFNDLYAYYADKGAWRMNPDFPDLLTELKARNIRMAAVSSFDSRLYGLLDAFGISGYFDVVVLPRNAGFQKPQAGFFLYLAAQLDLAPEVILHVGDRMKEDVEAAKGAGMQSMLWTFPLDDAGQAKERLLACLT